MADQFLHNTKIIDQNSLRENVGANLKAHLSSGGQVLISDVAFSEMTKNPILWEENFRHSTKILRNYPNQVLVAKTVGYIFGEEIRTGRPARENLSGTISSFSTNAFREHLRAMGNEDTNFGRKFRQNIKPAQDLANRNYFRGAFSKKNLLLWMSMWNDLLDEATKKMLRKELIPWPALQDVMLKHDINFLIFAIMRALKIPEDISANLVDSKSLLYLLILTNHTYALKWLALGGVESAPDNTIAMTLFTNSPKM